MLSGNNGKEFPSGQCTFSMVVVFAEKMSVGVSQLTAAIKLKAHPWTKYS